MSCSIGPHLCFWALLSVGLLRGGDKVIEIAKLMFAGALTSLLLLVAGHYSPEVPDLLLHIVRLVQGL